MDEVFVSTLPAPFERETNSKGAIFSQAVSITVDKEYLEEHAASIQEDLIKYGLDEEQLTEDKTLTDVRNEALQELKDQARQKGANAVINVSTTAIIPAVQYSALHITLVTAEGEAVINAI